MDTAQRIAATRSRLVSLQQDEHRAKRMGPPCIQCRHYVPPDRKPHGYCNHIALVDRKLVVVTGEFSERPAITAEAARSEDGLCGPEALLFHMNWWAVGKLRLDRAFTVLGAVVFVGAVGWEAGRVLHLWP